MNLCLSKALKFALLGWCALLAACSTAPQSIGRIDYKSSRSPLPALEVPPDLTQLAQNTPYALPGAPVSASDFAQSPAASAPATALNTVADVHFKRAGNQRWLVVDRPTETLWPLVRDFWQENGFSLDMNQPDLGLMETSWAENRAKIPAGFLRNSLGRIFDSLYSTGERDKFRTRLERNETGGTDIFISHRGVAEVYTDSGKDTTAWRPRTTDPELEIEFLRRLMVWLGVKAEQANVAASAADPAAASAFLIQGQARLEIKNNFDRAWQRVGMALEQDGFVVTDRDRQRGLYLVRYADPTQKRPEPGFFSRLFGRAKPPAPPTAYRIKLDEQGDRTLLSVQDEQGAPNNSEAAQRIAQLIARALG